MLEKIVSDQLFKKLDNITSGTLEVTTPDGKKRVFQGREPGEAANIDIYDWRVIPHMIQKGDIGFAEDYSAGLWDSNNLVTLSTLGLVNRQIMDRLVVGHPVYRIFSQIPYLFRMNTIQGSKKNIHAHYDLGNDFYRLWLDETMTYSSALFKNEKDDNFPNVPKYLFLYIVPKASQQSSIKIIFLFLIIFLSFIILVQLPSA